MKLGFKALYRLPFQMLS